jgi:hypothetical protein
MIYIIPKLSFANKTINEALATHGFSRVVQQ